MAAPTDLVDLGHGRGLLARAAAESVWRMDKAVGRPVQVTSAYRDWATQAEARRKYEAYIAYTRGGPWAPWAPLALRPEDSWHCRGMAVDTDDRWLIFRDHGWRFIVPTEPWHAQYYAGYDQHAHEGVPASVDVKPLPTTPDPLPPTIPEGADMFGYFLARLKGDKNVWIMNPFDHTKRVIGRTEYAAIKAAFKATNGKDLTVVEYEDAAQINGYRNVA